jgi:hypothetical protein
MTNSDVYPEWHGSPYDRGDADAYYSREKDPHYWPDGSYVGIRIEKKEMTAKELEAYHFGYDNCTDRKYE